MKKALKKLIPTIIMVLIAASMVGTSTFAWFSMNSKVTVTGMTVTTKLSNNLLIWTNNVEASYTRAIDQTRNALLEPTSTVDGIDYYYTSVTNVYGNGDAKNEVYVLYNEAESHTDTPAGKSAYDEDFNENYLIDHPTEIAYGYVDYVFYLKGTNASGSAQSIYADKCNLLYKGSAIDLDQAWRVAFFVQEATTLNTDVSTALETTDLITILAPSGADYFADGKAISTTNAGPTVNVANLGDDAVLFEVPSQTTKRIKVTVRLWLEGEDESCKNDTYADLTADWQLDLSFKLDENYSTAAVDEIGSSANVAVTGAGTATGSVTLTGTNTDTLANGEKAATFAWKTAAGAAASGTNNESTYTATATGDYYCVITTDVGNVYRTPVVHLVVGG